MRAALRDTGLLSVRDGRLAPSRNGFSVRFVKPNHFDLETAHHWYQCCRSNHTRICRNTKHRPQSLRLIDCWTHKIVQPLSWVDYAALSYVWPVSNQGSASEAIENLTIGDVLTDLPKTIADSMDVAKSLDIQYIWIDKYCINQRDSEDKLHQIKQMDAIYNCAELTIIAAAGDDPHHGLPGVNNTNRSTQKAVRVCNDFVVQTFPHPNVSLARSRWATRGW
jgi:hypothetical protein